MKSLRHRALLVLTLCITTLLGTAWAVLPSGNGQTTAAKSVSVVFASDAPGITATVTGGATAANQTTANTSLSSIATNTGRLPAQGAAAMAASVPVTLATNDTNSLFGTKTGAVTVQSSATSVLNVLPEAVYNTSAPAPSNGNQVPFQSDSAGNLKFAEQFAPVAEDNTAGVIKVELRNSYANQTAAATTTVKSGAGFLHAVCVSTCVAAATVKIFDNTAGSGTSIGIITCGATTVALPCQTFDVTFATGLTMLSSGATDVTESYR